jgi:hypothetical protein
MAAFLNHKNGQTWQSIPVCVFFTRDLEVLYQCTEYPAIYEKDRMGRSSIPLLHQSKCEVAHTVPVQ